MNATAAPGADARSDAIVTRVCARVAAVLDGLPPAARAARPVVAVSGGRDSVALLDMLVHVAPERLAGVATFDHGTGEHARAAARHTVALAEAAGLRVWVGRAPAGTPATEAAWRAARWRFLRTAAHEAGADGAPALVAAAHTRDDQLETVLMRALRGAGARGLAGMPGHSTGVLRPLLGVSRADVAAYAHARGLAWTEDPGNRARAHLRNRVRLDLLPRALGARPDFGQALWDLAERATVWRAAVDEAAAALDAGSEMTPRVEVPLAAVTGCDDAALRVVWPALAARAGVTLDRRGTARLGAFTRRCVARRAVGREPGGAIPLAGGAAVCLRLKDVRPNSSPEWVMVLGRDDGQPSSATDPPLAVLGLPEPHDTVTFGRWRFTREAACGASIVVEDPWCVQLPAGWRYVVRAWRPGDRMPYRPDGAARRVKRYLADRRVPAGARAGWPVVVAVPVNTFCSLTPAADPPGSVIVWIPGVRRSPAALVRPGEPGFILHCERT